MTTNQRVVIVRAVETSPACPSQWDAWDSTGRKVYFRYRHGHGSAEWDGPGGAELASFRTPDSRVADGRMDLYEFCELAGFELDLDPLLETHERSGADEAEPTEPDSRAELLGHAAPAAAADGADEEHPDRVAVVVRIEYVPDWRNGDAYPGAASALDAAQRDAELGSVADLLDAADRVTVSVERSRS